MTREEAIEALLILLRYEDDPVKYLALKMAIKALEQEPCEDAVSREAAISQIKWWFGLLKQNPDILVDAIKTLPSVTPERKKGKWIEDRCSECGCYVHHGYVRNFCPNCGADMRGDNDDQSK